MSKKLTNVIIVMVIIAMFSPIAQASELNSSLDNNLSFEKRKIEYEDNKKYPIIAPTLNYFVPTAGHLYAGDWTRGLKFPAISLGGAVMASAGSEAGNDGMALTGIGIMIGSHIWGMFDAYDTAKDYNENLKRKLRITPTHNINENRVGAKINYSF